jgi:hypothetical protein
MMDYEDYLTDQAEMAQELEDTVDDWQLVGANDGDRF